MVYYAKVNTADPRVGLITVGEYLTDAQASALGEDLLEKLVARGVLGRVFDGEQPVHAEAGSDGVDGANSSEDNCAELAEDAPEDESDDGDGMPELSVSDVVVNDAEDAAKPAPRKTRRNSK